MEFLRIFEKRCAELRSRELRPFGFHRTAHKLPRGVGAIEADPFNTVRQSEELQNTNTDPVYVDLVPTQTVTR
jgi:hypothetical protein